METFSLLLTKLFIFTDDNKGKGGLTLKIRFKLTSAARCAIKMPTRKQTTKLLCSYWT